MAMKVLQPGGAPDARHLAAVTDTAMSMRAECVMLNKGPFVAEATRMLARIIRDMEPRQYKKRALFSKLVEEIAEKLPAKVQGASGNEPTVPAPSRLGKRGPSPATSATRD